MRKNKIYKEGQDALNKYIDYMNAQVEYFNDVIKEVDDTGDVEESLQDEYLMAVRFVKTWEIMNNELSPNERNIILLHQCYNGDLDKTLEVFNGIGGDYKNKATLATMLSKVKRKIKGFYGNY